MYLGNPLLPIKLSAKGAADSVKKELEDRFWKDYELKPLKLNLVPYFLFNYHYYLEHDVSEKKVIKKASHGILAIDGHSITVREDLVELIKTNWKHGTALAPKGEFYEKWNNIEKREQDSVLALKTAEYFGVPKENVVVSSARKVFVPFYKTSIAVDEQEYHLIINGVDGTIEGIDKVPQREKGYIEIMRETIDELKQPKNWIKYSKDALHSGADAVFEKSKSVSAIKTTSQSVLFEFSKRNIILILAIIIALLLISYSILRF